ncbi:hypothetical protein RUM43_010526 [Polyplax serrata]|uniref:NAD(+) diphosphatase n=1 Tax=Polyplax serrata TaxID=468196 RepID=A0AAN8Q506_POLSC
MALIISLKQNHVFEKTKLCQHDVLHDKQFTDSEQFIKKAKYLERLKTDVTFPQSFYEYGKYILLLKNEMVCLDSNDKLLFHSFQEVSTWTANSRSVLLDVLPEANVFICLFALNLEISNAQKIERAINGRLVNIRESLFFLDAKDAQYVTHARGLFNFCKTFLFCNYCAGTLSVNAAGTRKQCMGCNAIHYPTLSPVGLTLIEDNNHEEVLLVRQERHPKGLYTCVAGFIEPGESVEENVRREVAEEVGLHVVKVEFCTSQHWALPASQLTLGCIATVMDKDVDVDSNEIENAKWVNADNLKDAVIRTRKLKKLTDIVEDKLWAPPQNAVSHNLMLAWLKRYHNFDCTSS